MNTRFTFALCLVASLILSACGGGGDDSPPAAKTVSINAALRHVLTDTKTWALNGSTPNGSFTLAMAIAPLPAAPFPIGGVSAARSKQTFTLAQGGTVTDIGGPTYYFDASTLTVAGSDNGDGTCSVATSNTALPASASVGQNGAFYDLSDRAGCLASSNSVGTTAATWSLETDAGVVQFCWKSVAKTLAGADQGSLTTCFEVGGDGTLGTKARVTITALGQSITARNY